MNHVHVSGVCLCLLLRLVVRVPSCIYSVGMPPFVSSSYCLFALPATSAQLAFFPRRPWLPSPPLATFPT